MSQSRAKFLFAVCLTTLLTWGAIAAPPFGNLIPPAPGEETRILWQADLPAASKVAAAQNKPILIVFGADWCHYCKKLEKETLSQPEMARYINQTFVAVHLDADQEKKAMQTLKVKGLPCSVVLTPDAKLIGRIEGYKKGPEYREQLGNAEKNFQLIQTAASNRAAKSPR